MTQQQVSGIRVRPTHNLGGARNTRCRRGARRIVGDRLSGKLFILDSDTFTEDGETMVWGVDSPPLHAFRMAASLMRCISISLRVTARYQGRALIRR